MLNALVQSTREKVSWLLDLEIYVILRIRNSSLHVSLTTCKSYSSLRLSRRRLLNNTLAICESAKVQMQLYSSADELPAELCHVNFLLVSTVTQRV